ncbi:hypothetical protein AB0K21_21855 [Streptosporangium sp. NPDC049248]|uniref:hypothetical protein n=1 Tax=Streptosporangium sp. NPDC049248 TaxID=3155651 RepID=UPI0034156766
MEDDETLVLGRVTDPVVEELAAVYTAAMVRQMRSAGAGDDRLSMDEIRAAALAEVAVRVAATERGRIAAALLRRSVDLGVGGEHRMVDLGQGRQRPAGDPLVEGLREVVPWRWLRHGMARVIYRVLAEMVRCDQV